VLEMRDLIRGALSDVVFDRIVQSLREAAGIRIMGDPTRTVEQLQTRFSLSSDEKGSVLSALIEGGELSMWGLANAVTRIAEEATTYDRANRRVSVISESAQTIATNACRLGIFPASLTWSASAGRRGRWSTACWMLCGISQRARRSRLPSRGPESHALFDLSATPA
jgi:hypothetical protein